MAAQKEQQQQHSSLLTNGNNSNGGNACSVNSNLNATNPKGSTTCSSSVGGSSGGSGVNMQLQTTITPLNSDGSVESSVDGGCDGDAIVNKSSVVSGAIRDTTTEAMYDKLRLLNGHHQLGGVGALHTSSAIPAPTEASAPAAPHNHHHHQQPQIYRHHPVQPQTHPQSHSHMHVSITSLPPQLQTEHTLSHAHHHPQHAVASQCWPPRHYSTSWYSTPLNGGLSGGSAGAMSSDANIAGGAVISTPSEILTSAFASGVQPLSPHGGGGIANGSGANGSNGNLSSAQLNNCPISDDLMLKKGKGTCIPYR